MHNFKCQRGYTMIETIGVIAIIAVVTGSAVAFLNKAYARYKMTRLSQQIVEIQKSIDRRYAVKRTYENLSTKLLKNEHLLPNDVRIHEAHNTVRIYHKLGGEITIEQGGESYKIYFAGLPRYACAELIMQNWAIDTRGSLISMSVLNRGILRWKCSSREQNCYQMPISYAQAISICKDNSTVAWNFY